jgi:RNA polymerase sigma-70 factor (ECF subfamily)
MGQTLDRNTFDRLVLQHLPACLQFALRLSGNPSIAEEVVQDAMLNAAKYWKSFKGQSAFRTWLFRIVINAWHDHWSTRQWHDQELSEDVADERTNPVLDAEETEIGEAVAKAISTLPPRQREVLVMIAYEGMQVSEVAAALRISEQNIRTNLHLARERLRKKLKAFLPENSSEVR